MPFTKKSLRLSIALIAFAAVSAAGFSMRWNNVLASFGAAGTAAGPEIVANAPLTIGTCDTAGPIEVEATAGTAGPTAYATLTDAVTAINAGTHQGAINVEVCGNSTEAGPVVLNSSGAVPASYTSINIRPLVDGVSISGPTTTGRGLIELNGADNVTIDGDNPNTAGTNRNLTLTNTAASTTTYSSVIRIAVATSVVTSADNCTIKNLVLNGSASGRNVSTATSTTGSENTSYAVLAGAGASTSSATTPPSAITSISTTIGSGATVSNLVVDNNVITNASRGVAIQGAATTVFPGLVISNNTIGNPVTAAPDGIYALGILINGTTNGVVSGNTVYVEGWLPSSSSNQAIAVGTISTSTTGVTIEKNKVNRMIDNSLSGFNAYGINLGGGNGHIVRNNFVSGVTTFSNANFSTTFGAFGIRVATGTGHIIYHNSVNMYGTLVGAGSSNTLTAAFGVVGTTSTGMNVRNNIFQNLLTGGGASTAHVAVYLPTSATSAMNLTWNNNAYFTGTTSGVHGVAHVGTTYTATPAGPTTYAGLYTAASFDSTSTSPNANFRAYTSILSAVGTNDNASIASSTPAPFTSNTDLHIPNGTTTLLESGGASGTGVVDDIDLQARSASTPDIGADEFTGILPPANDIAVYAFVVPANGGTVPTGTAGNPQASFRNVGIATQTNVGVQFSITGPGGFAYSNSTTIPTIAPGQTVTVTFATTPVITAAGTYNMTAAVTTADSNPANDIINGTFTAVPPFSGTYTVGSGGNYASLTNAGGIFDAMNSAGATGSVTINITSDLSGETGTIALNEIGFPVTIKPTGAARTVTGSSTNSIIRLNGADNVTIDGSLAGGTGTGVGGTASIRNLTVQNTNTAATGGAVFAVMQGANSANNDTIKNVIISGQDPTQTLIGIHIGGNTIGAAPTVASNNNVIVDNCAFKRSFIGIFNDGVSAAVPATGNVISHNDLTATGADRMRRAGIFFFNQNGIQVTENSIAGIVADESADAIGIIAGLQNVTTTTATSGGVYNAVIAKNRINGVTSVSTVGFSAVGIAIAGDPAGPNFIGNNMISGTSAPSTAPDIVAGIFIAGVTSSNTHAIYNSVSNTGDRGAVASQIGSYGIAISGTNPIVELKDNIFYTTQTSGGGANAKSYAIGMTSTTFTNLNSNYNDFFSSGANAGGFRTGSLDATGTDLANLAAWQAATGTDGNSLAVDPTFVNPVSDLHLLAGSPMINAGVVLVVVTDDIDGDPRGAAPDIGADEFVPANTPPTITAAPGVTRQAGSPSSNSTIATVTDAESGNGAVVVTVTSANPSSGVTISNIVNTNGTVTADVVANCSATNASFTLQASDGSLTATTTLNVNVTANSTPTLTYANASVASGGSTTVNPATGPSDNGGIATIVVQSTGTYTGTISVNNATGVVSISGAAPAGAHTITIRATDNCGALTDASFMLTVTPPAGPVTVTATAGTTGPTNYPTLKDAVDAVNAGTHQGAVTIGIVTSTVESAPVVLNSSGAGAALYTSVLIRPASDGVSVSGATVSGRGLIELNGADNVTIDGDNPNTAGINRNLTLQNTAANTTTFTSVVRIALATTIVTSADNDTIKNLNIIGSSGGRNISTATSTTASEYTTFGFFAGPGASTVSDTTAPSAVTSVLTSVGAGATAANLLVSNNSIITAARGVSANGSATTVFPALQISGNRIGNQTAGSVDQVTAVGITAQGSANGVISGNTIWVEGYIASSSSTHGINVGVNSAVGTFTIDSNMVNRVRNNNGQTWSAFGINLGGGSSHIVQNNFVSGVMNDQTAGTGAFGTTFGAYGIRVASGTGHKVYNNSIHLYGPLAGVTSTDLTAAFMITSTTLTGVDVRNNIFSNQISGGSPTGTRNVALYLPSAGTSAMNLTDNNNAYYAGTDALNRLAQVGATFGTGEYLVANFDPTSTTPATNLRAYTSTLSAAGTNDNASFATSSAPPFTSNVNLHIPAGTATRLESGGAAVGVTLDIDTETRNATTPDIGADEFAGLPPFAHDMQASTFVTPPNGGTVLVGQTFSPQASFTNNGTLTETSVTVRYKITDPSTTIVYNQTAVIPTIAPLQNVVVTFPSTSLAAAGVHTIQASSELVGDQNTSNDSISGTLNAVLPLGGSINVGTGQTYTSLTNPGGVFEALNNAGISGNLVVNVTSDLTAETGVVPLNQILESGAGGYTVTIKPSGVARTISGTAASLSMIKLNGADRITIDGSLAGGTDRSLTILYTNTGGTVIWIAAASASNGANNDTIKNCIIASNPGTVSISGILAGSGTTLGGPAEAPNNNNSVLNNQIFRVQNSLYNQGNTGLDQNWNISNNIFGSAVVADKNSFRGMLMGNAQNFTISGNVVNGISSTTTTAAAMTGIQLAFNVSNGSVVNNKISDIKNNSASGTGAFGMQLSSSPATNVTIANNFISDVITLGSATIVNNGHGINVNGAASAGAYKIDFNSINMNTNQASGTTSALNVTSAVTAAGAIDLRNNILANTQTTGATRYAVYSAAAATVLNPIDYNDYFAQNVGFIGGSARVTLGDWQAATGQDANSKAVDPLFISASDLHIQNGSPMANSAVGGTGITTDIDGDPRGTPPDIGADEILNVVPGTLQFSSATYSQTENGGSATISVTRSGGTDGAVGVNFATANGSATGGASCTAGVDYVTNSGTLSWASGDGAAKTFSVTICDDALSEGDETVSLTLSAATGGATIGNPGTAVLTIIDNEPPPATVQFSSSTYFDDESQTAVVTVSRTGNTTGTSTVNYSTSDSTAIGGASCIYGIDYVMSSGTITFGPTETTKTVNIQLCADVLRESTELFNISLSNPNPGTVIGSTSIASVSINDTAADYRNTAPIAIFDGSAASPYPSQITVTDAAGPIGSMRVTLYDFADINAADIDVLLVGPGGQNIILMGDAGGAAGLTTAKTLTFSDSAGQVLPQVGTFNNAQYEPTTWTPGQSNFPAPAPIGPYNEPGSTVGGTPTLASVFGGTDPNGTWKLFIRDDNGLITPLGSINGNVAGGWGIEFFTQAGGSATISGHVLDDLGGPVPYLTITVSGGGLPQPISTRTNNFGNYRLPALPVGPTYTVTGTGARRTLTPSQFSITLTGNIRNANFTRITP